MQQITTDAGAWEAFPHLRYTYNKLDLSTQLGYRCGPAGIAVTEEGHYIVRPIYNLSGMGVGVRIHYIRPYDYWYTIKSDFCPPGYFWCEHFEGDIWSFDFDWVTEEPILSVRSESINRTSAFSWIKLSSKDITQEQRNQCAIRINLMKLIVKSTNAEHPCVVNFEFVGDRLIETHLRPNPDFNVSDPVFTRKTPVYGPSPHRWQGVADFEPAADDADGNLRPGRIGFIVEKP